MVASKVSAAAEMFHCTHTYLKTNGHVGQRELREAGVRWRGGRERERDEGERWGGKVLVLLYCHDSGANC